MNYTIAAIPTVYRGRKYRSRLEARWAAFFDLLGWRHEYEPFDLGGWSPDFLLRGEGRTVLVEVKPVPVKEIGWDLMHKAWRACRQMRRTDTVLYLSVAPEVRRGVVFIGRAFEVEDPALFGPFQTDSYGAVLGWLKDYDRPRFVPDVIATAPEGWFALLRGDGDTDFDRISRYDEYTMELWAKATDLVQWKGPDA